VLRLFYVDESRDRGTTGHHYFVGLLAEAEAVARAEAELEVIAEQAWDDEMARWGAELHAAEIFNGSKAWEHGSIQQRIDLLEATLTVIGNAGIEVIARGANMKRFAERYPGVEPYRWEFSNLLERLNERLRRVGDYGLVISDQQTEHREAIQHDVARSKQYGTGGYRSQKLERILDTAHFVDSKLSRMIQLADMAAFVLRRRASHETEGDARLEVVMERLARLVYDAIPEPKGQFHTIR
jgi:hypothetical protein